MLLRLLATGNALDKNGKPIKSLGFGFLHGSAYSEYRAWNNPLWELAYPYSSVEQGRMS